MRHGGLACRTTADHTAAFTCIVACGRSGSLREGGCSLLPWKKAPSYMGLLSALPVHGPPAVRRAVWDVHEFAGTSA